MEICLPIGYDWSTGGIVDPSDDAASRLETNPPHAPVNGISPCVYHEIVKVPVAAIVFGLA